MAEYNGWTNYETWAVNLWLTNDEGSSSHWEREARLARDVYELAQNLKESVTDDAPDLGASVYADLLNAALSEVDWSEIARHFIDGQRDDDAEDDDAEGGA